MKNYSTAIIKNMKNYLLTVLSIILLASCGSDDPENARLQVVLVDAPAEYDQVNIDVQEVNVKLDTGWTDVSDFDPQVMNLLDLVNGTEAVLADTDIPAGRLGEVRLVLGDNNSLVISGESVDLTIPSGSESGLKIKINQDLLAGVTYKLILDFDAAKSIVETGNGEFKLKPVIRANMEAQTGAISGSISPAEDGVVVYAIVNDDSVSTYSDADGLFLISALEANTYNVVAINATDTTSVDGIEVVVGEVADAGELKFE